MENLLYGAAYYDEYMPEERLQEDIRLLQKAHMNVVRIGESTWATCEPQDGVFDFSHVTKVIEAMGKAGISVIIGTPTYAVPSWMVKEYPDVLATTKTGRGLYGPRQIMDITNKTYLFYAERVIRKMMEICLPYRNVIGIQLDNETKAYGTAGRNVQAGFVKYLKEKFHGSCEEMNRAFGLDYWSNRVNSWEDFPDVRGTINGSLGAEFQRYQRKLVAGFLSWQRSIVDEYRRPDQFVTHNTDFSWRGYSYGLNGETDVYENAKAFTVTGTDIYHPSQKHLTGMEIAFGGDVTRSTKSDNYYVLETEAQGFAQWLPYRGQLRLQAYSHLASGADMVEYWHWHSLHNAAETYWKGVLSHDFKENDTYRACCQVGAEWEKVGSHLIHLKKHNKVAILVSNASLTAMDWFPIGERGETHYNDILMKCYSALYRRNHECDILFPQNAAEKMKDYSLVVIPALYAASEELLAAIDAYVRAGGHVVATFKTGFADENVKVWHDSAPHLLDKTFGVSYSHFTYPEDIALSSKDPDLDGKEVQTFMELLHPDGAKTIAVYQNSPFGEAAAITRNTCGAGWAIYLGCGFPDAALETFLDETAREAGDVPQVSAAFPVIVRKGTNQLGKELAYLLNYSGNGQEVFWNGKEMEDVFTKQKILSGNRVTIGPWDLRILEGL